MPWLIRKIDKDNVYHGSQHNSVEVALMGTLLKTTKCWYFDANKSVPILYEVHTISLHRVSISLDYH